MSVVSINILVVLYENTIMNNVQFGLVGCYWVSILHPGTFLMMCSSIQYKYKNSAIR